jgi:hypothetical protein
MNKKMAGWRALYHLEINGDNKIMIPPGNQPRAQPGQQWHIEVARNNQDHIEAVEQVAVAALEGSK